MDILSADGWVFWIDEGMCSLEYLSLWKQCGVYFWGVVKKAVLIYKGFRFGLLLSRGLQVVIPQGPRTAAEFNSWVVTRD